MERRAALAHVIEVPSARERLVTSLTAWDVSALGEMVPRSYIDLGIGDCSGFIWILVFLGSARRDTKCKGDDICMQCCSGWRS